MAADLGPWEPYDVERAQRCFASSRATWWLSGGVALDRFLGYRSRAHGDIDVSVRRRDWPALAPQLRESLDVFVAKHGQVTPIGDRPVTDDVHNLWAREHDGGPWRVQVNLEPGDDERWQYRRDERITRPWSDVIRRDRDLPYVAPAVQLLWNAKYVDAKHQRDYDVVLPRLDAAERDWLAHAIALAHPDSPWREA
jgi:hypothetical protein